MTESAHLTDLVIALAEVYEFATEGGRVTKRVLFDDVENQRVYLIDLKTGRAPKYSVSREELLANTKDRRAVPTDDPYSYLKKPDIDIPALQREERDRRLRILSPYVSADPKDRCLRGTELMRQITSRPKGDPNHISRSRAYELARQFDQRGGIRNALLSDRDNQGYTEERRKKNPPTKKEGRSRNGSRKQKRAGVVITPAQQELLYPSIKRNRETLEANGRKPKWKDVLQHVCEEHYCEKIVFVGNLEVHIPKRKSDCPTVEQIHKIYVKFRDIEEELRNREGEKAFNLRHRGLHGDRRDIASGPMQVVQVDFQVAKIFLGHCKTRKTMGRPRIAMIKDTFSDEILAIVASWRNESWALASSAILQMLTDKVELCKDYGYQIQPEWWPCSGVFWETSLTDNGAMIAFLKEHFDDCLKPQNRNTASGRADEKGVIESGFADLNENCTYKLSGAILPGDTFAEKRASIRHALSQPLIDLHQYQTALLHYAVRHNLSRLLRKYPLSDDMLGRVAPIPNELWKFGMLNRSGVLRIVPVESARLFCLSREIATVAEDGIRFKGKRYTCQQAEDEHWNTIAENEGRWKVEVLYYKHNLEHIYVLDQDKKRKSKNPKDWMQTCWRINTEGDTPYISEQELTILYQEQAAVNYEASENELQINAEYNAIVNSLNDAAEVLHKATIPGSPSITLAESRTARESEVAAQDAEFHKNLGIASPPKSQKFFDNNYFGDLVQSELDVIKKLTNSSK
jgi:hypothetical protein